MGAPARPSIQDLDQVSSGVVIAQDSALLQARDYRSDPASYASSPPYITGQEALVGLVRWTALSRYVGHGRELYATATSTPRIVEAYL